MEEKLEIMNLLQSKQTLTKELNNLIYGSVEIREKDSNKYIYVHYREDGILLTKYVGEYSDNLYNLILNNSIKAKELKKEIKKIEKQLKQFNYIDEELSPQVEINIDFAKRHLVDTIYKQAILEGVATTFADTESIIEGGKINNMSSEDVLKIVKMDVDENPNTARAFGIMSIPTLLFKKDGQVVKQVAGVHTAEQIKAIVAELS